MKKKTFEMHAVSQKQTREGQSEDSIPVMKQSNLHSLRTNIRSYSGQTTRSSLKRKKKIEQGMEKLKIHRNVREPGVASETEIAAM